MQDDMPATTKKVKRCLDYARPHWRLYAVVLGLSLASSAIALATPYLSKIFFDDVLANGKFEIFTLVIGAFLGAFLIGRSIAIVQSFLSIRLSQRITNSVRFSVFSHLHDLHIGFFRERNVGDLLLRFTNDVPAVYRLISVIANGVVLNILGVLASLAIALSLNWQITVFALLTVPVLVITERYFLDRQLGMRKSLIEKSAELFDFVNDSLKHYITIRIFGKEEAKSREFMEKTNTYDKALLDEYALSTKQSLINELISYAPTFIVLAYGGLLVLNGESTIGTIVALQLYIPQIYSPVFSAIGFNRNIRFELLSVDRVFEILDSKPAVEEAPDVRSLKDVEGTIAAEGVNISLDRKRILKGVDFSARPGRITALAGPSGIGKTTLTYTLARLYDPDRGRVSLDGVDLRDIRLRSLRKNLCLVTQEPFIFSGSVEDNIRFPDPKASDEEIRRAAKVAQVDAFIEEFPEGYAAHVGVHGSKLSLGQMQRIALARAILAKPRVLLIDEGFNSVDAVSEYRIMRELRKLAREGRTIVLTSHRLSVLREADEIFLLHGGRVVERGSYGELVEKRGRFYNLYKHQLQLKATGNSSPGAREGI